MILEIFITRCVIFSNRANNICHLAQLNALADLQGLASLHIAKEGNPLVHNELWFHYTAYRLSHWGLEHVNGREVSVSEFKVTILIFNICSKRNVSSRQRNMVPIINNNN